MALPAMESGGQLPEGVHEATLAEVLERFGNQSHQRTIVTQRLERIIEAAKSTGKLSRAIVFGSYVTSKRDPNDVDVVLIMDDDFQVTSCQGDVFKLFDQNQSAGEFGASVFWVRPSMLFLESLDEFISHWQITRDGTYRGIVEVRP